MIRLSSDLTLIKAISSHYHPGTVQTASVTTEAALMNEVCRLPETLGVMKHAAGSVSQHEVRAPKGVSGSLRHKL